MTKCYSELITIPSFIDRLNYLKTNSEVGDAKFGSRRYIEQYLYQNNQQWKRFRREIILRDSNGDTSLDLAHPDCPFYGYIIVHHINPLTIDDIINNSDKVFDPENVITCSHKTHNQIHFGKKAHDTYETTIRTQNDTCPWRR